MGVGAGTCSRLPDSALQPRATSRRPGAWVVRESERGAGPRISAPARAATARVTARTEMRASLARAMITLRHGTQTHPRTPLYGP